MTGPQPTSVPTTLTSDQDAAPAPSRRTVLRMVGLGGALATVTFMAGCGSNEGSSSEVPAKVQEAVQQAVASGSVPVGSGLVLEDVGAVVTQPTQGEYHVFSSTCPHANGKVTTFEQGRPACLLHGSMFDPKTGDVVAGPSQQGLRKYDVSLPGATG